MTIHRGMSLLEVIIATALLSIVAVSMLGWFSSTSHSSRNSELLLDSPLLGRAADQIVLNPDRFGVPRTSNGRYRWESGNEIRDRTGIIDGAYKVKLLRTTNTTDYIEISGSQGSITRWFIVSPEGIR